MKFKKLIAIIAIFVLAVSSTSFAQSKIRVFVDNTEIKFDSSPSIVSGRVMVPVRAVFEKTGATVSWDNDTRTTTLTNSDYVVTIKEGEPFFFKNNKPIALEVPATIIDGRLCIPVRAIAEAMDFGVTWNSIRNSVLVSTSGKPYRATAQWKTGFYALNDGAFVSSYSLNDVEFFDLDGDAEKDKLAFIPTKYLDDGTKEIPALWINGKCFNDVLNNDFSAYAIAVADIVAEDKYKEIIVLYASDLGRCAGFYRYNGVDVFQIESNNNDSGMIYFNNTIFFDGVENIISDIDGYCFLDSMICSGLYSLEKSQLCRYMLELSNVVEKEFIRSYNDDLPYCYKEVEHYIKGTYVDSDRGDEIISSNHIASFEVIDYYVNEQDPSKHEIYVQLPDKTKIVLWPYNV